MSARVARVTAGTFFAILALAALLKSLEVALQLVGDDLQPGSVARLVQFAAGLAIIAGSIDRAACRRHASEMRRTRNRTILRLNAWCVVMCDRDERGEWIEREEAEFLVALGEQYRMADADFRKAIANV